MTPDAPGSPLESVGVPDIALPQTFAQTSGAGSLGQRRRYTRFSRRAIRALPIGKAKHWIARSTPHAAIHESQPLHFRWLIDITTIDQDRATHAIADTLHVEGFELIPFGDHHQRVRVLGHLIAGLAI